MNSGRNELLGSLRSQLFTITQQVSLRVGALVVFLVLATYFESPHLVPHLVYKVQYFLFGRIACYLSAPIQSGSAVMNLSILRTNWKSKNI